MTEDPSHATTGVKVPKEVIAKRDAANFPFSHKLLRLIWAIVWGLFASWTPPQFNAWRRFLLRAFGAEIHSTASVRGGAKIWYPPNLRMEAHTSIAAGVQIYNMAQITLRDGAIVSQGAFLCGGTHDFQLGSNPLVKRPIEIGRRSWIASEAFISAGVTVPEGCVIGARAVVTGKLEPWSVYAGNPARRIKARNFLPST